MHVQGQFSIPTAVLAATLALVPLHATESRSRDERPSRAANDATGSLVELGSLNRGMVLIPAGEYAPLIRSKDEPERVAVQSFWIDVRAVTNAEFLEFVRTNPQWRRSAVSPLFADTQYLGRWSGDLELGPGAPEHAPVVSVSWFAARAFARAQGKRLPATALENLGIALAAPFALW